ncbi:D-beta-hydroxybutyrate dehydrogenase, mitochondrial [Tachysurus ichikawai]
MASQTLLRAALLVVLSVILTLLLAFALPAALTWLAHCAGFSEDAGATHCLALVYALFVLCVAMPRIPRGSVSVEGKAVFVTGCDRGFGHALAKHLHKLGFTVFAGCYLKVTCCRYTNSTELKCGEGVRM